MPDYSKAKLYSIRSHHTEDIYIGSTCGRLSHRLHDHKAKYKRYKLGKVSYTTSFSILKYPDYYIELIRDVPCSNKQELLLLEGKEIRSTKCVNKRVAGGMLGSNRSEYDRQIYERKKDIRNCVCGGSYDYRTESKREKHGRTDMHQKYLSDFYSRLRKQLTR